jgi:SET domain
MPIVINPYDISELLFQQPTDLTNEIDAEPTTCDNENVCYVGPISIIQQQQQHLESQTMENKKTTTTTTSSTSSSSLSSKGRCMVASRPVEAGELLFVSLPIVQANVQNVWYEWTQRKLSYTNSSCKTDSLTITVAEVAEHFLLLACKEAIMRKKYGIINCLSALERTTDTNCTSSTNTAIDDTNAFATSTTSTKRTTSIRCLLGQETEYDCYGNNDDDHVVQLSDDDIIQIIRRNAFGSDFPTINRIEQRWLDVLANDTDPDTDNDNNNINSSNGAGTIKNVILPSRLLGIYGLASMINHSCIPNAARVFVNELMIVHACQPISVGEEIVWSYIPLIHPCHQRQSQLQQTHSFICHCNRCRVELGLFSSSSPIYEQLIQMQQADNDSEHIVHQLENDILQNVNLSNEMKRYLRMSYMQHYMNYINDTMMRHLNNDSNNNTYTVDCTAEKKLLALTFQLHLSFVACHNVSTEHLSVRTLLFVHIEFLFALVRIHVSMYFFCSGDNNIRLFSFS